MIQLKKDPFLKWAVVITLCCSVFLGCNNFYEVSEGTLYRSRQLNANQFDKYIHQYGIKTVINLRGQSPQEKWYLEELAVMQKNGTQHFDFKLTAIKYVSSEMIDSIITTSSSAPNNYSFKL